MLLNSLTMIEQVDMIVEWWGKKKNNWLKEKITLMMPVTNLRESLKYKQQELRGIRVQKSANIATSSAGASATSFQSSSGYSSKLFVSPAWLNFGTIGGWKKE